MGAQSSGVHTHPAGLQEKKPRMKSVAKGGLNDWVKYKSKSQGLYYYRSESRKQSLWINPANLPAGWVLVRDQTQKSSYYNIFFGGKIVGGAFHQKAPFGTEFSAGVTVGTDDVSTPVGEYVLCTSKAGTSGDGGVLGK